MFTIQTFWASLSTKNHLLMSHGVHVKFALVILLFTIAPSLASAERELILEGSFVCPDKTRLKLSYEEGLLKVINSQATSDATLIELPLSEDDYRVINYHNNSDTYTTIYLKESEDETHRISRRLIPKKNLSLNQYSSILRSGKIFFGLLSMDFPSETVKLQILFSNAGESFLVQRIYVYIEKYNEQTSEFETLTDSVCARELDYR